MSSVRVLEEEGDSSWMAGDPAQLKEDGEMSSVGGLLQARSLVVGQLA